MKIARAYKVALDPNDAQRTAFSRHAGAARWAYNWGLATWKRLYGERKAAVTEGEKVGKVTDAMDLHKRLNALKKSSIEDGGVPWMYETSKCAPQESLRDLERAYQNTFRRLSEGKKGGFPKFKSKHKSRKSFRLTGAIAIKDDRIKIPVVGWVRLAESSYVPTDTPIKSITVSEKAGRWFVSVLVEQEQGAPVPNPDGQVIGVDLGVNALATCSDGTVYENPKALNQMVGKIKSLSKRMARQEKGSNRRKKTKLKLARAHTRAMNIRVDAIHKMTTEIVKTKRPSVIVLEDLNVAGMVKNHCLARSVSDAAFGEARRQFEYKALWNGAEVMFTHRFFPSTKRCSACGVVRESVGLGERMFVCPSCGFIAGRDVNASYNLRDYPSLGWKPKITASSAGCARGGIVRPVRLPKGASDRQIPVKREVDSRVVSA